MRLRRVAADHIAIYASEADRARASVSAVLS